MERNFATYFTPNISILHFLILCIVLVLTHKQSVPFHTGQKMYESDPILIFRPTDGCGFRMPSVPLHPSLTLTNEMFLGIIKRVMKFDEPETRLHYLK